MNRRTKYPPGLRERAIRMVYEQREHHESQWAAIESVAQKIGYTAQTLKNWIAKAEGKADADDAASAPRVKELEREVRELKRANEILKLASAFLAQAELDRRVK
jgi:transposase